MKTKTLYKFLRTGLKSDNGKQRDWIIGEWKKTKDKIKMCHSGFHTLKTPLQALYYVKGEILAEVEVKGNLTIQDDKECWSEMRIIKAWHWTKNDSVELAIFAAEQVIDIYEKKYPNDPRPRNAIEAAKNYLKIESRAVYAAADAVAYATAYAVADAARATDAARAAYAAADATRAVYAAAYAADAADATRAVYVARATDAADVARVTQENLIVKIDKWFLKKLKTLKEYE